MSVKRVMAMEPFDGLDTQYQGIVDAGHEVVVGPYVSEKDKIYPKEDVIRFGNEFDVILGLGREKMTREIIEQSDRICAIGKCGAGYDHIDAQAATDKGILVLTTPGMNSIEVAEYAVAMMMALLKKIPYADRRVRELYWRDTPTIGHGVYEKTVGICGFGDIGRRVAERLQGWGCKLLAYDPYMDEEKMNSFGLKVTKADWDTLFTQSDIITLHMPLTEETRDSIGEREFRMMKRTAVIVNTARGRIIHKDSLVAALKNGEIAGAALDTHYNEPITGTYELLSVYENVILTPHLGGYAYPALARMSYRMCEYVNMVLAGNVPPRVANPEAIPLWKKRFG